MTPPSTLVTWGPLGASPAPETQAALLEPRFHSWRKCHISPESLRKPGFTLSWLTPSFSSLLGPHVTLRDTAQHLQAPQGTKTPRAPSIQQFCDKDRKLAGKEEVYGVGSALHPTLWLCPCPHLVLRSFPGPQFWHQNSPVPLRASLTRTEQAPPAALSARVAGCLSPRNSVPREQTSLTLVTSHQGK